MLITKCLLQAVLLRSGFFLSFDRKSKKSILLMMMKAPSMLLCLADEIETLLHLSKASKIQIILPRAASSNVLLF
ncbi:hypothetical protein T4A_2488 [Trichinella pseudospiralis]|uniref:Uncharacterized protein n=1 Tax=Trichinella pseudospiralis TaxID=6337 RepID=A0A0V1FTF1_TRIPS|nr:hypothetical protein T4E_3072 [Trichinella pseudospiralis]KRY66689.1 hypothetical protein T4A_2488 [Trichinella pseudospiralis]KRY89319.1 hypothetical protein T4D_1035 [Trichinella pseudospiralis]KRZ36029.1 hypothetical protein T4C_8536 [Trichinella pseudospiralis]